MKQFISFFFIYATVITVSAQDINDALRYANDNLEGSSRFQAMAGAFGALGGDLTAFAYNPAGSAVYNYGQFGISIINRGYSNNALYGNSFNATTNSNTDLNQVGFVMVLRSNGKSNLWNKITFGFNYDQNNSFDNIWRGVGYNSQSVSNYFLNHAQGKRLDEISALDGETLNTAYSEIGHFYGQSHQQAFLGYESFIIDPLEYDDSNSSYYSNLGTGTFSQDYYDFSEGYNSQYTFNIGTQYKDKLQLGFNMNYHSFRYNNSTDMIENNNNDNSQIKYINFQNNMYATGDGISFQFGAIFKATESLRLGLTYKSPTWFTVEEQLQQSISTNGEYLDENDENLLPFSFYPNTINLYAPYNISTPSSSTASVAYVFGKIGLISLDYNYKNYSNIKFGPSNDPYFREQNQIISSSLKSASSFRIGSEFRFDNLSLRGGFKLQDSPYKDERILSDQKTFSLGIGYNVGASRIDFVYSITDFDQNKFINYSDITTPVSMKTELSNFGVSYIYNF